MEERSVPNSKGAKFNETPSWKPDLSSLSEIVHYYYNHSSKWSDKRKDMFLKHYASRQPLVSLDPSALEPIDFVQNYVELQPSELRRNDKARFTRFLQKLLSVHKINKENREEFYQPVVDMHKKYYETGMPPKVFFDSIKAWAAQKNQRGPSLDNSSRQIEAPLQDPQEMTQLPKDHYPEGAYPPNPYSNIHSSYFSGSQGRHEEASQSSSQYQSEEGSSAHHYRDQPYGALTHGSSPSYNWEEHQAPSQTRLDAWHMAEPPPSSSSSAKFQDDLPFTIPDNLDILLHDFPDLRPGTVHGHNPYEMQHDPHPANNPPQQHDPFFMQQQSEMPHYPQPFPFQDPASHYHPNPRLPPPR